MTENRSNQIDKTNIENIEGELYAKAMSTDDDALDAQKTYLQLQQDKAVENKINELFFPDTTCD